MTVSTPDWVKDAVFYQIFPDRFSRSGRVAQPSNIQAWGATPNFHAFQGGDLPGIVDRLDYLVDLGVNALFLNPIFASTANHRYHTHDYFQVDPLLGGNAAFDDFIRAAKARGVRVILDGVFNHASRGFLPFNHLLEAGDQSPYVDWFHVFGWPLNAYDERTPPNYAAWWGLHALPKLNTDTPAVREYLWQIGTYWLERGIDGWRLDVPAEIDDDEFWREFRRRCRAVNPEAYIVGELWDEAARWLQGDQFDAQMNYLFTRAAFGFFGGERLNRDDVARSGYQAIPTLDAEAFGATLDYINNQLYAYEIVLAQLNMLGSHDTPRLLTVANGDRKSVRLLFLCQMTQPGAPNIYYGDEIGMAGRHDPLNRAAFPWDDRDSWDEDLLADVRRYIALRHGTPALRRGDFRILVAADDVVAYRRRYRGQTAVVVFNIADEPRPVTIPFTDNPNARLAEQLASPGKAEALAPNMTIVLPRRSGRVWTD